MDLRFKDEFLEKWRRYFGESELPVALYFTEDESHVEPASQPSGHQCLIGAIGRVRRGASLRFSARNVGCGGGLIWSGLEPELWPDFAQFLSTGVPGELEGERYIKTPELAEEVMAGWERFEAPAPNLVFKRWDQLDEADEPEVVVFFARPDVLSALFTLANYDRAEPAVVSPFGSGCSSIIRTPYLESRSDEPRCVLGMFDITARPCVEKDVLTFAIPMAKFRTMVADMDESFLIAPDWQRLRKRL